MMQMDVRNKMHCESENILHLCLSERCPHTARHQESVADMRGGGGILGAHTCHGRCRQVSQKNVGRCQAVW